jgi:hypothetical protein
VPGSSVSFSPRVGFNWDILGDRKYILRGGTGLFVGRMPFVWLVSAVGNSGMGSYHSERSFLAFSHERAVVKSPSWIDVPFRYMPYKFFGIIKRML